MPGVRSEFNTNGYVYIDYTDDTWAVQVIRYQFAADNPDRLDPESAHTILTVPKKSKYHNGGTLAFGPDGYLYISVGDDEQSDAAQDVSKLCGKILRIDPNGGDTYTIPPSNPFTSQPGAAAEVWVYGLRNPGRFSFDRRNGDLWIGDVGEANWEEVDLERAGSGGGENYGWPRQEGFTAIRKAPIPARRRESPSRWSSSTTIRWPWATCRRSGQPEGRGREERGARGRSFASSAASLRAYRC